MTLVYRRYAGTVQVKVDTFAELREAVMIPETQWAATSAPLPTLVADPRFLRLLDTDDNNRIRVDELQAAVGWLAGRLQNVAGVDQRSDVLLLDHVTTGPAGDVLREAAVAVLEAIGVEDRTRITAAQLKDAQKPLREAGKNGDGIVAPRHLTEQLRPLAEKILRLYPETKNRGGEPGLAPATLQAFRDERQKILAGHEKKTALFVWGDGSFEQAQRIEAVRSKIEEHFLLCRLVASQPDLRDRLRLTADKLETLVGDRAALEKALRSLPLAPPDPAGVITWSTLHRGPAWEELMGFSTDIAGPLTKDPLRLTEAAWLELSKQANLILAWHRELETSPLAPLAAELAAVDEADLDALAAAQARDLAQATRLQGIDDLERTVLYQRWLLPFANSFLSMPDLYSASRRALFERGDAILAGRRYTLSVMVPDVGAHKAQTEQGTSCVIYAHIEQKDGTSLYDVAIPKTRGWSTEINVGRRGIFYDINGAEFDAVVTHVVRNPISVFEAAVSPFIRLGEVINKRIAMLGAGADETLQQKTADLSAKLNASKAVVAVPAAPALVAGAPVAAPAPAGTAPVSSVSPVSPPAPAMGNALAAGGLAVAAVGSSVAFVASQLKSLTVVDVLSIIAIAFVSVALPSGFIGWLKLRRRNLAQLLEGAGWALNDRLRVTPALAALVTQKPRRPAGSQTQTVLLSSVGDEDEDEHQTWWIAVIAVVLLAISLWQVKDPLLRGGCHSRQVPEAVCAALQIEIPVDEEPSP